MKKELIYDNGKLRNCTHNDAIMTIWQLVKQDHYWLGTLIQSKSHWRGWNTPISAFVQWAFVLPLFPILPFVRAWDSRHRARRAVANQEKYKKKIDDLHK